MLMMIAEAHANRLVGGNRRTVANPAERVCDCWSADEFGNVAGTVKIAVAEQSAANRSERRQI